MPDQLGLTTVNKKDVDLFVVETDLTVMTFPGRRTGALNRRMAGQTLADETARIADVEALDEATDFDTGADWVLARVDGETENRKLHIGTALKPVFTIVNTDTIALPDLEYIWSFIFTNAGGSDVTVSVGTSAGGTQIIDSFVVGAGDTEIYVVNYFQAAAGNIHFTLDTGSLTIRLIRI